MTVFNKQVRNIFKNVSLKEFKNSVELLAQEISNEIGNDDETISIWAMTDTPLSRGPCDFDDPKDDQFFKDENEKRTVHALTNLADLTEEIWADTGVKYIQVDVRAQNAKKETRVGIVKTFKKKRINLSIL